MNFASTNSSPENRGSRVRDGQKPREFSGFLAIWHPGARRPETPFLAIPHPDGASMGTHGALGVPEMKECRAIPMGWTIGGAEWVWTP